MAVLLIVLLILFLLIGRRYYGQYINPISLFPCVQFFALLLLFSSDFISKELINHKTHLIYFVSIFSYMIGVALSCIRRKKLIEVDGSTTGSYYIPKQKEYYQGKIKSLGVILLFSTIVYWGILIGSYGANDFLNNLLHTRASDYTSRVPAIISYLKMVSVFLSPLTTYYIICFREKRFLYWLILALTIVSNIAYTRNVLFYLIIIDLFVVVYSRKTTERNLSFKSIIIVASIVLTIYFFVFTQTAFNKQLDFGGTLFGKAINSSWITVITYISGPFVSTSIYLDTINNTLILGHTMRSIIGLSSIFGVRIDTTLYQPTQFVQIPFRFNTATMQYYIFSEGGWIWTVVFFTALGYLCHRSFYEYERNRCFTNMLLLCFISLMLVISIREYTLVRVDMFFYLLLLIVFSLQEKGKIKHVTLSYNSLRGRQ